MDESATISYVTADGTAKNGVNYTAVSSTLTFEEGQALEEFTVPIIESHVGRSHHKSDRGRTDDRQYRSASSDGLTQGPASLCTAHAKSDRISPAIQPTGHPHLCP